jgi:hypothetical protein
MKKTLIGTAFLIMVHGIALAQELDEASTQRILDAKNYIFKAQTMSPQRAQMRTLNSEYDLTVRNDSVIAWLPYVGRSTSPQYGSSEGGIKFTSAKFDYTSEKGKKKKWEITIKPQDVDDVKQVYLTVFENGQATLQVISNSRDAISFNGYIVEGKIKK